MVQKENGCSDTRNIDVKPASRGILLGDYMGRETARLGLLIFVSSLRALEAPGLQLKIRERARFRYDDFRPQREHMVDRLFDAFACALHPCRNRLRLDIL